MNSYIYAGPSLGDDHDLLAKQDRVVLLPPIKRGDLDQLVENQKPETVVIADGIFHNHPPVAHQEIRRAIAQGWQVFGVASMGAIRAYEMRDLGMIGYGWVYNWFLENPEFTDDEVTLTHLPIRPYRPISEALINIRVIVQKKVDEGTLKEEEANAIIYELKQLYFGDRTLSRLLGIANKICGHRLSDKEIHDHLLISDANRIKNIDLKNLINEKPWLH